MTKKIIRNFKVEKLFRENRRNLDFFEDFFELPPCKNLK